MSETAYLLLERFLKKRKETGKAEFYVEDYADVPGHQQAIRELINEGIAEESDDILQKLTIDLNYLREYLRRE